MFVKIKTLSVALFGLLTGLTPGFATEYFVSTNGVDTNPGTSNAPYATINKAATVAQAGDTVWIMPGLYQPAAMIQPANSGTASAPITYRAQTGGSVFIDGQTTVPVSSGRKGLFYINGKSWIVVDGLRVINSGFSGIFMENSTNITVQNCSTFFTYASGIVAAGGSHITVLSNSVQQACMLPSPGTGVNECITMASVNTFEVAYNTVFDRLTDPANGGEGIDAKNACLNGRIHHNHVYDLVRLGIYVDGYSRNLTNVAVHANTIHDCAAGIAVASEAGAIVNGVQIYNNLIYDCRTSVGIRLAGYLDNGPLLNVDVYQNTVVRCGKTNAGSWENCGLLVEADNTNNFNFNIRNNIFSQNAAQIRTKGQPYLTLDRNLLDGPLQGGVTGSNPILAAPLFVNAAANDFRLASNSPAIDVALGAPLAIWDRDDVARPVAGPGSAVAIGDLGAFEWHLTLPATTTTLTSSTNPASFGTGVTFTATVTSTNGVPTGTVSFLDGVALIGSNSLNGAGVATFTTSVLSVGSHAITAAYGGNVTNSASTSAVLTQSITSTAIVTTVTAYFTDGMGASTPQQYPGIAGEGWVGGWANTSLVTPLVTNTSPVRAGTGNYLTVIRTSGSGSGSQEGAYRQWAESILPTTNFIRLTFDLRLDSATNVFNNAGDSFAIALNSGTGASAGGNSTVLLRVFGAATGDLATREWGVFNGDPGVANAYDVFRFRPTGLIAQPGVTYSFIVDSYAGSGAGVTGGKTNGTYDVVITDGTNTVQFANAGFRSAAYAAGGYLAFSAQQDNTTDNLAFSADSIVIAPLTPLQLWRKSYFTAAQLANPALESTVWGNLADFDLDGVGNLLEYALGTNPNGADGPAQLRPGTDAQGRLTVTFQRIADPALLYEIVGSDDLVNWPVIWSSTGASNVPGSVTVTDPALLPQFQRFVRLRVSLP
jgi:hypothetical protein